MGSPNPVGRLKTFSHPSCSFWMGLHEGAGDRAGPFVRFAFEARKRPAAPHFVFTMKMCVPAYDVR